MGRFQRRGKKPSIPFTCAPFPCGRFRLRRVQSAARHPRDRGSIFVTRVPRSHGEMRCNDWGSAARIWGRQLGDCCREHMGRRCGATTVFLPTRCTHDTAYTRQDATRTHTCRPHDGAARVASAILSTHLFCLRRLRLFMFDISVITFTTAHWRRTRLWLNLGSRILALWNLDYCPALVFHLVNNCYFIGSINNECDVFVAVKDRVVNFIGLENEPGISTIGERPG